ncbi:MAG: AsnC family transcriptional regulator [Candidatus Ranarchaeia archaeon]
MSERKYIFKSELWKLIDEMIKGGYQVISPEIDLSSNLGYRYPKIEELLEEETEKVIEDLEMLSKLNILKKEVSFFTSSCPKCNNTKLLVNQNCPNCHKQTISKKELIECLNCGAIQENSNKISSCVECKSEFKRKNEDFTVFESFFCISCKTSSSEPIIIANCTSCGEKVKFSELKQNSIFSYQFNMEERSKLYSLLGSRPLLTREKPSKRRKILQDRISKRILSMIQKNSRRSFRDIGRRLGVSEATIRARVRKFQTGNVIKSFTTILNPNALGIENYGIILIQGKPDKITKSLNVISEIHEIKTIYELSGGLELILIGYFNDSKHMQKVIKEIGRNRGLEIKKVYSAVNIHKSDFKIDIEKYLVERE